jgi:NADH dehydrogenase
MRVLVTGGSGVVGRPTVERLVELGHTVRLLSRHADRDARDWKEGVEGRVADVGDAASLAGAADGCDAVLHLAGIIAEDPPAVTFQKVHVDGTRHLVAESERAGVKRFVYVSSLGAHRGSSDYHRSKRAAEEVVRRFAGQWLVLRPGNVYGPGDEVISLLLKMLRAAPTVPVIGDGDQPFQPIWAGDLAGALARAVEEDAPAGETLELAGPEVTTTNQVLDRRAPGGGLQDLAECRHGDLVEQGRGAGVRADLEA